MVRGYAGGGAGHEAMRGSLCLYVMYYGYSLSSDLAAFCGPVEPAAGVVPYLAVSCLLCYLCCRFAPDTCSAVEDCLGICSGLCEAESILKLVCW